MFRWCFSITAKIACWILFTPVARTHADDGIKQAAVNFEKNREIHVKAVDADYVYLTPTLTIPRGYTALFIPIKGTPRLLCGPATFDKQSLEGLKEFVVGQPFGHAAIFPTVKVRVVDNFRKEKPQKEKKES